mgnify:CR=1 FL=1
MASVNVKNNVIPFLIAAVVVIVTFLLFNEMESYFSALLRDVSANHVAYSFISFLVLTSDIVLPVPSSIVMYLNGYVLGILIGSLVSLISLLVSSIIGYFVGRLTSLGLKVKSERNANEVLAKYGTLSILISRGIPILSESICIVCGYNQVPFKQYLFFNLVGYAPLCLLYAVCGSLGYDKDLFFISFGCSILISFAFWLFGKKLIIANLVADEE